MSLYVSRLGKPAQLFLAVVTLHVAPIPTSLLFWVIVKVPLTQMQTASLTCLNTMIAHVAPIAPTFLNHRPTRIWTVTHSLNELVLGVVSLSVKRFDSILDQKEPAV